MPLSSFKYARAPCLWFLPLWSFIDIDRQADGVISCLCPLWLYSPPDDDDKYRAKSEHRALASLTALLRYHIISRTIISLIVGLLLWGRGLAPNNAKRRPYLSVSGVCPLRTMRYNALWFLCKCDKRQQKIQNVLDIFVGVDVCHFNWCQVLSTAYCQWRYEREQLLQDLRYWRFQGIFLGTRKQMIKKVASSKTFVWQVTFWIQ